MRNFVVGICSLFENDVRQFAITAENEYEAVKKGMLEYSGNNVDELFWQSSPNYPKDYEGLCTVYEEMPFSILEVKEFLTN